MRSISIQFNFFLIFFSIISLRSQTPIKQIEGLEAITFYEVTAGMNQHSFDLESYELNNRYPNHMNSSNNDFVGWVGHEFYDVFFSNEDGTLNEDGVYITIEATFHNSSGGGGLNIAEISFDFDDGRSMFGSYIASYQGLGSNYMAGSELNAADCDLTTHTTMGHTVSSNPAKLRLTIGFYIQETNIELCELIVPNVFTPNGDRINDEFSVFVMKNCEVLSFSIDIFDRWGNLVFNSQDLNFKWNGTKGDQSVLGGVYAYIIKFISGEEDEKIIVGNLTIIH